MPGSGCLVECMTLGQGGGIFTAVALAWHHQSQGTVKMAFVVPELELEELRELVYAISHRVARFLEKRGLLERDAENSYLALESSDDDAMMQLQGHSITYRIAVGPQQGRNVFTLQTLPPDEDSPGGAPPCGSDRVAKEAGFSLHAGVSAEGHQRGKLDRHVLRSAAASPRRSERSAGQLPRMAK